MNFQHFNFDFVEPPHSSDLASKVHRSLSGRSNNNNRRSSSWSENRSSYENESHSPQTARQKRQRERRKNRRTQESSTNRYSVVSDLSVSPQASIIPPAPSPPSPSDSTSELYGPERLFPAQPYFYPVGYNAPRTQTNAVVHFDEGQLTMFAAENAARMASIKDELAMAAGTVTPGVDDTPYIQYALQALTGEPQEAESSVPLHLLPGYLYDPSDDYRVPEMLPSDQASMRRHPVSYPQLNHPTVAHVPERGIVDRYSNYQSELGSDYHSRPRSPNLDINLLRAARWMPISKNLHQSIDPQMMTYQPLTFKPRILRTFSLLILATLCLLMTAALIFCAVYSNQHHGLTPYPGSIYSGQYFVFRILPQILGAIIFVYAQSVVKASLRILPFTSLASEDPAERYMSSFQSLYSNSFFLPQFIGPWQFKLFDIATWLAIFTIPLLSTAFTCIFVDGRWIWASVQGVVWTLVALYVFLLFATAILMTYWFNQWTGLIWDMRSIGDILPLFNRSNCMESYGQSELAVSHDDFKAQLRERWFDRLGYWRVDDRSTNGAIWYALGASNDAQNPNFLRGKKGSRDPSVDSRDVAPVGSFDRARGKYLPWCLRDGPVFASVAITSLLLLAILIVSFLPSTRLESGFPPKLSAAPNSSAFSAANFTFSFIPSLIGMILYLGFQSIDQSLRILQPWADLYEVNGAPARASLLADYAACAPIYVSWKAVKNGHWRVAVMSLLATLFVFIPILAGGLFMALTADDGRVRIFPSMPVFGVLLAHLFFFVGGLILMIPQRRKFLLPRPVTSIAAMASFCSADELTQDAAFRSVRGREDLESRLGVGGRNKRQESTWFFGVVPGRDEQRLSIRRMKRFTERRMRTRSVV